MDIIKKASENIFDRLGWNTASRDQAGIAATLANEQKVHEVTVLVMPDCLMNFSASCVNLGS